MTTLTTSAPVLDARGARPRTYHVRTLGCQMNVHDSEHMAGLLERAGYLRVEDVPEAAARATDAGDGGADVVIINTCSVRENAATRLFGNLGQLAAVKRERPGMQIAVAGCLAQQMGEGIVERAPWVDVVFGTHNLDVLPALLERARHNSAAAVELEESLKVFPSTLPTRRESSYAAWVSIAVGCNNTCTFCIVPSLRGKQRDRRPGDVLAEVEAVAAQGAIEVTLLGQNVNSYGVGFGDRGAFAKLLRATGAVEGIERVRFTSPHPAAFTDDVIEAMATTEAVMPSLHMPLQSGSDRVLRAMRRSYRTQRFLGILDKVRAVMPDAAITTDIIVGFPGETEEDFQATLDVVEQARFASAYTFEYSPRPGTPAADRDDQVPTEVVKDRYRRLDALVRRIVHEENERQEGRVVEVLVAEGEGRRDSATARISGRAADNRLVHVALPEGLGEDDYAGGAPRPGDMVTVRVTHGAPHNLIADSARCGRELDPLAVAANEALKPGDRLWLDDGPALFQVRRTRAGDAWERRQAEACATPEPDTAPVSLGLPTLRVGAPV
ncbi:tRNA-2-methylthio-N(6)-dimethylallyladenosine synthase MiaB [Actinomyces sp. HMSC075C01]|uniref:tRNA-2-methylthio-N(6)-dimethylallyladenosine synthase n=1 Tax=Actinomyces oris TaxID=544580 RepID=A0A1Q8W2D4_9ACTO|nr:MULTISPECIES: tRNA (N6-isopentenyl adenosine(37)-C2)-methylthiotransferase MiaB [Actinomyces]OFR59633.1 tRNA-2-methylthio-N(6)-dimethylallyladenosine synthase MiaB [Actinomyces sp. HMSC075C01]OLO55645.1 tRNA (N6-isopentenyl adenosine(37)-C2)-methylthiotransferase MiaB [Actinomyces oris]